MEICREREKKSWRNRKKKWSETANISLLFAFYALRRIWNVIRRKQCQWLQSNRISFSILCARRHEKKYVNERRNGNTPYTLSFHIIFIESSLIKQWILLLWFCVSFVFNGSHWSCEEVVANRIFAWAHTRK